MSRPPRRQTLELPPRAPLRGEAKLQAALDAFHVDIDGRVALDVGAAAGGFTRVLLRGGARRIYAVDAGHGQLLGSLRQDERVVNLEATNIAALDRTVVGDVIDVVTIDVSYMALATAVAQLDRIALAPDADLIGLVKPMFELRLASAPSEPAVVDAAAVRAVAGIESAGWSVVAQIHSPVRGSRGAPEVLLHARLAASEP
ncbi:MAG: SAM-dependent methyltransferase [Candidatus Dormibacteria bacterium]